jgi:S-DNA-T family DNA segregation ATPase FtsK/SpoIIIE
LDTPEVEQICEFIGGQQGYPEAYQLPEYESEEGSLGGGGNYSADERDSMFEEAARIVVIHQQGSASLLQRKLKLGYNRAGRLIDQLEDAGIIGPFEGSKARQVLIQDEMQLNERLKNL